jgi:Lrp/AsnC family leucine-responsive transcriptional regulator
MKDRQILYQLDLDSRQSLTKIGKKVRLRKDIVAYRIKRMQQDGIITGFWTQIDSYKLGYIVFRFYLVYQYVTPEIKNNIINYLVKDKRTWVVESIIGKYDLGVFIWVKNIRDFYQFWEKLLDKYGDYFAEKIFSIYVQGFSYPCSYLLPNEYVKSDRQKYEITCGGPDVDIDEYDFHLLNLLVENTRISLVEMASELHSSTQMAKSRLKKLMKSNVVQAFRVAINISKLGLKPFKVDIHLQEHVQRKPIMDYIKHHPNLVYIGTSAGVSDLELEFDLEDSDKVHQILEDINQRFSNAIRKYEYFSIEQNYKIRFLPEI